MNPRRYRIEYGASALNDLDSLPEKIKKQILRKIERLEAGLHGDINIFAEPTWRTDYAQAIIASCSTSNVTLL